MAADKKPKKEKKSKNKSKSGYYSIEGDTLKRNRKSCPKCGAGVFMSEHKNRFSCGKCSYSEMQR